MKSTFLIFIIGVIISISAFFLVIQRLEKETKNGFLRSASDHAALIENGFDHVINFVEFYAAFFEASELITHSEFKRFSTPVLTHHSPVHGIGFAPLIVHNKKEEFERKARIEHDPNYMITEYCLEHGGLLPVKIKDEYFPIFYIYPHESNKKAVGYDLSSEKIRNEAIKLARETHETISTGRIILVQEDNIDHKIYSMLTMHPLYLGKDNSFSGIVSAMYHVGKGVDNTLIDLAPTGIDIWVYDRSAKDDSQFLFFHPSRLTPNRPFVEPSNHKYNYSSIHDFGGRDIELFFEPAPGFWECNYTFAWIVLFGGLTITILLTSFISLKMKREQDLEINNKKLEIISREDVLMNIANRRYFNEYIAKEWKRSIREQIPISIVIGDIDKFKNYNDSYGHIKGDKCLSKIGHELSKIVNRPSDMIARYGGEEIAAILPNTDIAGALGISMRIKDAVDRLKIPHKSSPVSNFVTISIGYGTITPTKDISLSEFLAHVDVALYDAKSGGRNRIVESPEFQVR